MVYDSATMNILKDIKGVYLVSTKASRLGVQPRGDGKVNDNFVNVVTNKEVKEFTQLGYTEYKRVFYESGLADTNVFPIYMFSGDMVTFPYLLKGVTKMRYEFTVRENVGTAEWYPVGESYFYISLYDENSDLQSAQIKSGGNKIMHARTVGGEMSYVYTGVLSDMSGILNSVECVIKRATEGTIDFKVYDQRLFLEEVAENTFLVELDGSLIYPKEDVIKIVRMGDYRRFNVKPLN